MTILNKIAYIMHELEKEYLYQPGDNISLWVSEHFARLIYKDMVSLTSVTGFDASNMVFQGMRIKRMSNPVLVGFFSIKMEGDNLEIPIAYFDKVSVISYFLEKHNYGQIPIYTFDDERPALDYEIMKKDSSEIIISEEVGTFPTELAVTFKKLKL